MAQEALDLMRLDEILSQAPTQRESLIPVLQQVQEAYGYLPQEALKAISKRLSVPLQRVLGVATFYSQFRLTPYGRHVVQQCDGTACHVRGSQGIIETMERELGIKAGDTTGDMRITYQVVYCLGCCSIGPAALVDGEFVGHLTSQKMSEIIGTLQ